MKQFGPGLLFFGSVLIAASVLLVVIYIFYSLMILPGLVLEDCMFLGIYFIQVVQFVGI